MRGQRLFVRPIESADHEELLSFLRRNGGHAIPAYGLLGKLAGELVAVLAMRVTPDAVQITDIVIATELRRKRIGRVMLDELEQFASKLNRRRLVVEGEPEVAEFLRRVGFEREGAQWVRKVRQ